MLSFTPYPNSKETCSLQLKARFREIPGRMNHPWYKQNHFELEVCEIGLTRLLSINTFFLRGVFGPACRNILSGASKISIDVSTEIFFWPSRDQFRSEDEEHASLRLVSRCRNDWGVSLSYHVPESCKILYFEAGNKNGFGAHQF